MAKVKTSFFCQNCGVQSGKWIGKCPSCNEWNTYVEEVIQKNENSPGIRDSANKRTAQPTLIDQINAGEQNRISIGDQEFNRVLGGGLVHGSLIL
ncbi:MAG: DNA repair protein RadA, partial [Dolichospermum sp.]